MSTVESTVTWKTGLAFEVAQDGHRFILDAGPDVGGKDLGPRPKALLLSGLGGCTGIDVVSILDKMRVPVEGVAVQVSAELTDEHPRVFKSIHVRYVFTGTHLPMEKLEKAVALSSEKYCGVSAMLAKACPVTHEIVVEAPR